MLFQTLDEKSHCVGIYTNNRLIFDPKEFPQTLTQTWKYVPYLRGLNVDYASLYLEGSSIADHIPEYLEDDWFDVSKKLVAFKRSLSISQVNTEENCFFDLVPQRFLIEYCEVRNKITKYIFKSVPKPERYEFYKHVSMMLGDIGEREVKLDIRKIRSYLKNPKLKNQATALMTSPPFVKYRQFGTRTGRLTTQPNTFPILTLNKEFRSAVLPRNDYFIELDFNGAEVRTLLGLLNKEQPSEDVHDFHLKNIFHSLASRSEAKVAFFAWLYGSKSSSSVSESKDLEAFYERNTLLEKYWKNNTIITPFKKIIKDTSRHHALNYLVQSTAAELTLKQALKLEYLLRSQSTGSKIAFLIHDAVVIDMKKEDGSLLTSLVSLMSSTNFGTFGVNIKRGKTLGSMREIKIG